MRRDTRFMLAASVFTVGLWSAVSRGPYHFDDFTTPVEDPASQSIGAWFFHVAQTLRPLAKLTYAIEGSLGAGPAARRVVSAVILGACAALVFALCRRLAVRRWPAFALALLFAAHPIHAEVVLAVAGRTAVLANALLLGAMLVALRARTKNADWLAGALFFLAVLARETALAGVLPLAVIVFMRRGTNREKLVRLEPIATASLVVIAWLLRHARYHALADYAFHARPVAPSIVAQVSAIPIGASLFARASALTIDHGERLPASAASWLFALGVCTYALAALAIWKWRRSARLVAIGAALWLAAIVPTQSIIPKLDALTERPLSLAWAGVVIALGAALAPGGPLRRRAFAPFAIVVAALALSIATIARGRLYASDEALWRDATTKSPKTTGNARPFYNYALALVALGRRDEALAEAKRAAEIDPFDSDIAKLIAALRE